MVSAGSRNHTEDLIEIEFKSSVWTIGVAVIGALISLAPIPVSLVKRGSFEEVPTDIFCTAVGLSILIASLWVEHVRSKRLLDYIHAQNVKNHRDLLLNTEARIKDILSVLLLDRELASHDDDVRALKRLLNAPENGMEKLKVQIVVNLVKNHFDYFQLNLDRPDFEANRMAELTCAVNNAERYAYACTYCDPKYIWGFWAGPGDAALTNYYDAHRNAIRKSSSRVQRIFIMTEELKRDEDAYGLYTSILHKLLSTGMTQIFEIDENQARARIGHPAASFLVADDAFVSQSLPAKIAVPGEALRREVTGWIAFDREQAERLRDEFEALRNSPGKILITAAYLNALGSAKAGSSRHGG